MDKTIYVTMFNKFTITYGDQTIDSDIIKSDKLVKLLAYMFINSKHAITSSALVDVLWYYDDINNPLGALKNLIYRLRTLLKNELGLTDLIITGKGAYSINQDYILHVDAIEFEKYNDTLNQKTSTLEDYEQFIKQYTGKYLLEIKEDHKVIAKSAYYHSIFIDRALEYAQLLEDNQQYDKMEDLARRAIVIDNLEEKIYEILIRSFYYQKQYQKANEAYKRTTEFLYQNLGVKPSQELQELYNTIKKEYHDDDADLFEIQEELKHDDHHGAYLCEYGTFKEFYAIQSRIIGRLGICSHICLVTLEDNHPNVTDEQKRHQFYEKCMSKIQNALVNGLRSCDVVSRFGLHQFVVLLPGCNYENSLTVLNRVLRETRYSFNHTYLNIDLRTDEILPKE